jgi:ABC-type antimicrobial peptide transport system permease subunit
LGLLAFFSPLLVFTDGVVSYSVAQRTREIGIRSALGATRVDITKLVISQGLEVSIIGAFIGFLASLALGRVLSSFLFRVTVTDPMTFIFVGLMLVAVAAIAAYLPARRAARVDPLVALRTE